MTKNDIMSRCRKVAVRVEGKRIFGDPDKPYARAQIYRTREIAEQAVTESRNAWSDNPNSRIEICEFYLVPASRIDYDPVQK